MMIQDRRPGDIIDLFENRRGLAELWLAILRDGGEVSESMRLALKTYFTSCVIHCEEAQE